MTLPTLPGSSVIRLCYAHLLDYSMYTMLIICVYACYISYIRFIVLTAYESVTN